jgi:PAS domain S-box-containing protein
MRRLDDYIPDAHAQLRLFSTAVESARNGIVITDPNRPDNPIIYANPAFGELTGFGVDEIIGQNCRFLQGGDRDQSAIGAIREAIVKEQPITTILRNYRKNGSLFWNELTVSPVHDATGRLLNFVGVQNDITARVEAERRVSEFYSVMTHELRTPLSSIHGALTAMEDGCAGRLPSNAKKLIAIAIQNSTRLVGLISDLLDWKKIEAGQFELHWQPGNPEDAIDVVLCEMNPAANRAAITLDKEIHSHHEIHFDQDRIVQVLGNLVSNAIKFSAPETRVVIRLETSLGATRFSVIDEGPGIEAQHLDKLFVKFQQLDSCDKRQKGGTGLGLAIAKTLVELHGGRIGVSTQPGRGSTFWFEIFDQPPIQSRDSDAD